MVILCRQLHKDFLMFVNWTRPSERWGNFYEVARGQHPLLSALSTAQCWEPQLSKRYRVDRRTPIFSGQQYSSCSKAVGCRTPELLGAFRMNLLIVSWVTPTPGSTANFPGNRCSQPLILCPFGRSGPELLYRLQCEVEPFIINFSLSTTKKGYRKGPGSGNLLGWSLPKATISQRQYQYQNHTKVKSQLLCIYYYICSSTPGLFWDRIRIRLWIRGRSVEEFF
jgi:hypothetical protein